MTKAVEFLFDFGSPTSYLAYKRLPGIAQKSGAEIVWRPVLLGAIHAATGNTSPAAVPAKGRHMAVDLQRFAELYRTPFSRNPHFPINTLSLMRGATAYKPRKEFLRYVDIVFDAMWKDPRNLGDAETLYAVLEDAGFDTAEFAALIHDPGVKDRLKEETQKAVDRGVFGAPTFFVAEEMFFGQDRLDFVEAALEGRSGTPGREVG